MPTNKNGVKVTTAIVKRLQKINDQSGLSNRQFSLSLGHAASVVQEIYAQRIKTLSDSIILALELKYGVNPEWLKTGKGPQKSGGRFITDEDELSLLDLFCLLRKEQKQTLQSLAKTFLLENKKEAPTRRRAPNQKKKE